MTKVLVYSHDTYGLGNIRRMLAVVEHLVERDPDVCALILSGSPMMQAFRLSPRIDYIKLPCLLRSEDGDYKAKYLDLSYKNIITLRADLILNTLLNFEPDLILVDKKPLGVQNELAPAFDVLRRRANRPRVALILREILDSRKLTQSIWERNGYHDALQEHYDSVLVLGPRAVFDTAAEYRFPTSTTSKIRHCGYIAKRNTLRSTDAVRHELGAGDKPIVVITAGGGRDGFELLRTGLRALLPDSDAGRLHLVVVPGPEMAPGRRDELHALAGAQQQMTVIDFTNDMMSYLRAADTVVSMAGYNTVTELLSLGVSAVLVPRAAPSQEQWMRATRLERLGLFKVIHPDQVTESSLRNAVFNVLYREKTSGESTKLDMQGLDAVYEQVRQLLSDHDTGGWKKLQLNEHGHSSKDGERLVNVLAMPRARAQQ